MFLTVDPLLSVTQPVHRITGGLKGIHFFKISCLAHVGLPLMLHIQMPLTGPTVTYFNIVRIFII